MTDMNRLEQMLNHFIDLEEAARCAKNKAEFYFVTCNKTKEVLSYSQAIFFEKRTTGINIAAISGIAEINQDAPLVMMLKQLIAAIRHLAVAKTLHLIETSEIPPALQEDFGRWCQGNVLWCPLQSQSQDLNAGLLLMRNKTFSVPEIALMNKIIAAFSHAFGALELSRPPKNKYRFWGEDKKPCFLYGLIGLTILSVLLIPVRQTVLAPAEISAKNQVVVSSEVDGTIEKFFVKPNETVAAGQLLFTLDPILPQNRYAQAKSALEVSQEKYRKAYQHALTEADSKAELLVLASEIDKSQTELNYATEMLSRVQVRAKVPGVVIFSAPEDWLGKPVKMGERVLTIADEHQIEVKIQLPVAESIALKPGNDIHVFLNTNPLHTILAKLIYASYTAQETTDGMVAYRITGAFLDQKHLPRIGLKGTAKLYGRQVTLGYFLLWKPISFLRRTIGV